MPSHLARFRRRAAAPVHEVALQGLEATTEGCCLAIGAIDVVIVVVVIVVAALFDLFAALFLLLSLFPTLVVAVWPQVDSGVGLNPKRR
jgi:hypothetical protein